jgi:hypothetical protein
LKAKVRCGYLDQKLNQQKAGDAHSIV